MTRGEFIRWKFLWLSSFVTFASFSTSREESAQGTVSPWIYHGTIKENTVEGTEVDLKIPLFVNNWRKMHGDKICGYTLYKWNSEQPFRVVLTNKTTGSAKIVLNSGHRLDYERKHKYNFEVAPFDCITGAHGLREKVHIKVEDVNEFAPRWKEDFYSGFVEEGKLNDEIVKVEALDSDGSSFYSKICSYHITTEGVPFEINDKGYLRNTVVLSPVIQSQYKLEVTAEDCGGKASDKVDVEVEVEATCRPMWTGIDDRIEISGMRKHLLMSGAALELCSYVCSPNLISITVELDTSKVSRGCDRNMHSNQVQRKLCGSSSSTVLSLLPSPNAVGSWTADLPTDDIEVGEEPVFIFDGETAAVEIPFYEIDANLGSRFSIAMWMKHESISDRSGHTGNKEHILCNSDGRGNNRHHYAVFIHNCQLIFLLRQQPSESGMRNSADGWRPVEWRWTLSEVCDGRWHHYAINVNFSLVHLFIDGIAFINTEDNPDVLDDWSLHKTVDVRFTKLVVGACWQGGKSRIGQYFQGSLSGLTILTNETESEDVLRCLNNCEEKLEISGLNDIMSETSVSMNAQMNLVTINGLMLDSVEQLLHQIVYVNARLIPTPGDRLVTVQTEVKCSNEEHIEVEAMNLTIAIRELDPVEIAINGSTAVLIEEQNLVAGELIFPNLTLTANVNSYKNSDSEPNQQSSSDRNDDLDNLPLKSCSVRVEPKLNLEIEHLAFSESLVDQSILDFTQNEFGIIVSGIDKLQTYEKILHQVKYANSQPEAINVRSFIINCSAEPSQNFFSNQLQVTVEVVHVIHDKTGSAGGHAMTINKALHPIMSDNLRMIVKSFPNSLKYDSQETGIGVAVVMVVCIGFVIMLIILGVMRVRNSQSLGSEDELDDSKANPDWNNSTLTITVNPMDPENAYEERNNAKETENEGKEVICHSKSAEIPSHEEAQGHHEMMSLRSTLVF